MQEELLDVELSDGQLEEQLLDNPLNELHMLLQLSEIQLKLELTKLHELHGLMIDEDRQLHGELLDGELSEGDMDEKLVDIILDELHKLLELSEMLLKLEQERLQEEQTVISELEGEMQEELQKGELFEGDELDILLERKLEEVDGDD